METKLKYMFLIYGPDTAQLPADTPVISPGFAAYLETLKTAGILRAADRLRSVQTATSVRVRDGKTEVMDGPYADTKETFGGYITVETASMDEALDWAARCPAAEIGFIEVRPMA